MKFLTLNTHSWMEEYQEEKIKIIARNIKEKSYDMIALQEVNQSIEKKCIFKNIKEDNFALVLLKELESLGCMEYSMLWDFSHIGYDKYEEGVSILTKHKIKEDISFFITKSVDQTFWKTRKIIGATIKINEEPIDFYSCHLGWWHDEEEPFKDQADQLLSNIKKDRLTFIMGDFNNNAFVRNEGYDYLIEKGLYDTFSMAKEKDTGVTVKGKIAGWSSNKQDLRLDLILSNKKIGIKYSKVIFNGKNKPVVSDHYGVEIQTEGF
ncbi:endonuclease/exonuclease/phosphatase family protein [Crassaminicella profunda]|uniref:endonuclease/exonuclease/phosphatase family protein n=1 Tax=Crassaminicella profunda TaxID=1286698 RepID=UPI001CA67BE2|nr:endonuclease/exonuclease/phosphatase family protein [Crassaminicella profunda]QZY57303.1 endonuclease/exonuclease/phosphatase family protein [Crassaminicella profunda]